MLRLSRGLAAVLAATATLFAAEAGRKDVPVVYEGGVVNAAGFTPAPENFVAPGSIVAIFGEDLALRTRAATLGDLDQGGLPTELGGVWVILGGLRIPLYYVSPTQINVQIPFQLAPEVQRLRLTVSREGLAAQAGEVKLARAAPGLFPVALRSDYRLVGRGEIEGSVALKAGDVALLYGTGFGPLLPSRSGRLVDTGELPTEAADLALPIDVWLDDERLHYTAVLYAGQAPGFAGLYQVNITIPERTFEQDPEVRVEIDGRKSQPGFRLAID